MALYGIGLTPSSELAEGWYSREIFPARLSGRGFMCVKRSKFAYKGKSWTVRCFTSNKATSQLESEDNAQSALADLVEKESRHVTRFKESDFKMTNHVSVGLGGRADEVVFEAIVENPNRSVFSH
uniref:Uncharacterized protein MANES_06G159700 n=1 Tax=Rhizophora mucronata TaxID=61149 RepID=A0A2P2L638_RHIMU